VAARRANAIDRQQIGRDGESRAADLLQQSGLELLLRNYRCRGGELDLVARGAGVLVVAEVRMRSSTAFGGAAASITWRKQQRIVRATRHLLACRRELAHLPVRFDVLVADAPDAPLLWIRGAFDAR
jgi:putative endonuclease